MLVLTGKKMGLKRRGKHGDHEERRGIPPNYPGTKKLS
jgi:hypothetical protein